MKSIIKPEQAPVIRRVVIAFNGPPGNPASFRRAADLAARLKAEMRGLFIEDINLLRLAGLPQAREIAFGAAESRRLDAAGMERMLRTQAEAARQKLSAIASQRELPWSFQVRRGHVTQEVLSCATGEDLLILDRVEASLVSREEGKHCILQQCGCTVLVQHGGAYRARPVMVHVDDLAVSGRALRLAARYFLEGGHPLTVILPPLEEAQARQQVLAQLDGLGIPGRVHELPDSTSGSLLRTLVAAGGGLLISGVKTLQAHGERLLPWLERAGCDYLLVR